MKAMRKERERRYQSASELAQDIQNYIDGNPLIAGPESTAYRIKKYVRKRQRLVTAVAAIAVAVLIGFVVSTTMYFQAEKLRKETENARVAEAEQRKVADTERDRATEAKIQAQKSLVDSYEQQGRKYIEIGNLDGALLILSEAYKLNQRISLRLLLSQCFRQHQNSIFHRNYGLTPWKLNRSPISNPSFSISPHRGLIAIVDDDGGSVHVFDTNAGQLKMECICKNITYLTFTPDDCYMVAGVGQPDGSNVLKIWDLSQGRKTLSIEREFVDFNDIYQSESNTLPSIEDLDRLYRALYISPSTEWIVFADLIRSEGQLQSIVRSWDPKSKQIYMTPPGHFNSLITKIALRSNMAWNRESSNPSQSYMLATIDDRDMVYIWSLPDLKFEDKFEWETRFIAFEPHGKVLVNFHKERGGDFLDRRYNEILRAFPHAVYAGFSPNGKRFIIIEDSGSGSGDTQRSVTASLCNSRDGSHIANLTGRELKNWHFTTNSELLVTEDIDGQIKVWYTQDGRAAFDIPGEDNPQVTDISVDSFWLVTFSSTQNHGIKVWNLISGECFEPYSDGTLGRDLGVECLPINALPANTDRIFANSYKPPQLLPRFNSDGSALITGSGLRHLTGGTETAEEIKTLVEAHIPFRFENGRQRPASMEEMLRAKLDYNTLSKGNLAVQTINSTLDLILHEIQIGKLEKASLQANKLQPILPLGISNLSDRVEEVLKILSESYYIRADMKERRGNYTNAIHDYQTALTLNPNNHEILNRIAWLQSTCSDRETRDLRAAIKNATKACELTNWKHWRNLSTLAITYAQSEEFSEAIIYQQLAINLLPDDLQDRWKVNFEQRLSLFESNLLYDRKLFLNIPTENLIGWWNFDEAGSRIARDESGKGHHGRVIGSPKWQPGKVGTCLKLNDGDYINCGSDPIFNINDALTVSLWIRVEEPYKGNRNNPTILSKGDKSWRIRWSSYSDSISFDCIGLDTPDASFDGIRSMKKFGNDHCSSVAMTGTTGLNESDLLIGGSWQGFIDDVRIYNRALSEEEIVELYNETK